MEKRSKILLFIFVVITICSVYLTYRRAFIDRDFEIINSEEETI